MNKAMAAATLRCIVFAYRTCDPESVPTNKLAKVQSSCPGNPTHTGGSLRGEPSNLPFGTFQFGPPSNATASMAANAMHMTPQIR